MLRSSHQRSHKSAAHSSASDNGRTERATIRNFDHVTIVVRDIEAANRFFALSRFKESKSLALLVLAVSHIANPVVDWLAFGTGLTVGMGALSSIIAVPRVLLVHRLRLVNRDVHPAVGSLTIGVGSLTMDRMMSSRRALSDDGPANSYVL